ncbi:MAG: PEGA domain-containing protein [Chloroflexi bacterium]|nr:PEGA domain-containing protein [Chloroflexota bacterium]
MEFPIEVVFEPPSRSELRAWLRLRRVWVVCVLVLLAVGIAAGLAELGRADALASAPGVPLRIASHPSNARVWVDNRERGRTPLELSLAPGHHSAAIRAPGAHDGNYEVDVGMPGASLDANLFRAQPVVARIRPALPGATLDDVRLLDDGELALTAMLAPGQLETWRLDPSTGAIEPILTEITATRVAVAKDGTYAAYVGGDIGPRALTADQQATSGAVLWLQSTASSGTYAGWRPPPGEVVLDASWSPRAEALLVVTGRRASTADPAPLTRLWWVDHTADAARELRSLPSVVVPGSESWSPDGQHVAFVVHAGALNALCLMSADGSFRYLADLEGSSGPPLPYAPVGWASDSQHLLFSAPEQFRAPPAPSTWFQTTPVHVVFEASVSESLPTPVGAAQFAVPGWAPDGRIVGLGRAGSGDDAKLAVEVLSSGNRLDRILDVPLNATRNFAAEWDSAHSRAVVANRTSLGSIEYWSVLLGADDTSEGAP